MTEPNRLTIKLSKPQTLARRAFTDGATVNLSWGRGLGKTEFILLSMFLLVAEWDGKERRHEVSGASVRGVRIAYLMPAATQARKTVLDRFREKLDGQFRHLGGSINLVELRVTFPGGSWIQFVSQEQGTLVRGLRCDVIAVDECDDIDIEFFSAVCKPWLSEPFSLKRSLLGGTPKRGRYGLLHQTYRLGQARAEGHWSLHATWRDAPEHVDSAFVARERRIAEQTGQLPTFLREWECNFDSAGDLVYPMFSEAIHVRTPDPRVVWSEYLVGVDHGYEDPGCFLVIGVAGSGRDATCHVLREIYRKHQIEDWWEDRVPEVLAMRKGAVPMRWYADPSRPERIIALQKRGARFVEANNAIEDGVSSVANLLAVRETNDGRKFSRLYIDPSCVNTIRELGLYRRKRDPKNKEHVLDDIEDRNNHAMDALRYPCMTRFGVPHASRHVGTDQLLPF